jgi:hypothetical protein
MTNETSTSEEYDKARSALKEICEKFAELSSQDFSKIHVGIEWTWVPYFQDHLQFLKEQTEGVLSNLKDSPPPVAQEDLQVLTSQEQK